MTESNSQKTARIFALAKGLSAPLEALWLLLAFLFCKELGASPLQVTVLVAMKPISALGAFYGSVLILGRRARLKSYLIGVTLGGLLPCLLFPFVDNLWFFIAANGCFWISSRALILAWGEIFKLNLKHEERGKAFSRGSSLHSIIHIIIPILISPWLDFDPSSWKWIFFLLALVQAFNLILIRGLPIPEGAKTAPPRPSWLLPWKQGIALLKERKDFRHFQWVFFLGGGGLIMMHPVLPFFFKETLSLSYTEVSLATSVAKGLFFALSSSYWAKLYTKLPIYSFNTLVTSLAAGFAFLLILSPWIPSGLFLAYALYGVMQAGSEMSWNLSGPLFAKDGESTLFSSVNVACVGVRGSIAPFIGELLYLTGSKTLVFFVGGLLCLSASLLSRRSPEKEQLDTTLKQEVA